MTQTRLKLDHQETADAGLDSICAHSILWMLENATDKEDILACAEHISTLTTLSATRMVSQSPLFLMLIRRFVAAVTDINNAVPGSEQSALVFGRAVMHVVIADPMRWAEVVVRTLTSGPTKIRSLRGDLWALYASAYLTGSTIGFFPPDPDESLFPSDIVVKGGRVFADLNAWIRDHPTAVISALQPSTTLVLYSAMRFSPYGIQFDLLDPSMVHQDSVINLLCLEVIDLAEESRPSLDQRVRDVRLARNRTKVAEYIARAVEAHGRQILKGVACRGLLRYHTQVLRYCLSAHRLDWNRDSNMHVEAIREHLSHIIVHCRPTSDDLTPATDVGEAWYLWTLEGRLSKDPLVRIETLQAELMTYAMQLLLCLVTLWSDNHRDGYTFFTSEDATALVEGVAKLQSKFVAEVDIVHLLKAINIVISGQQGMMSNLTQRFVSICPMLTRVFGSTSYDVLDAACGVLAAFGDMAWGEVDKPRIEIEFLLPSEFSSAILSSLSRSPKDWSPDKDRSLCLWLAASIRLDTSLATTLDRSSVTSMFVSRLLGTLENKAAGDWATMWNVAYTFFKMWHSTAPNTASLDTEKSSVMGDAVLKSLVTFVQNRLWYIHHDTTNVEMFIFIADFVHQAFVLQPAAALFFGLDRAFERLTQRTKVWEEDVTRMQDVDGDDRARKE
ncbi:hypothetical protein FRB94_001479, partial [Tulasnella sp. JGI-2019a]